MFSVGSTRFWALFLSGILLALFLIFQPLQSWRISPGIPETVEKIPTIHKAIPGQTSNKFDWAERQQQYPVQQFHPLPVSVANQLPKVQYDFSSRKESREDMATRRQRMAQVKNSMKRCWSAYVLKAWMFDELAPVSGEGRTTFGGWAATLVDSLDTLWIMGMKTEFEEAVDAAVLIDFTESTMDTINIFETTIRYLGGFIAAYDLSQDERLLIKALEVANFIYAAFDTPNRMPVSRIDFNEAKEGATQLPARDAILAEVGSFTLEMTRLSQITRVPKWFDASQRIMQLLDDQQFSTALPGMWPIQVNSEAADFSSGHLFSLAAWADSLYEYLPKMVALLGESDQYAKMYNAVIETAIRYTLYKPMIKGDDDVLMAGAVRVIDGQAHIQPELQHLVCYVGGMFALGGRLMGNETHVEMGMKLTNGCVWAYKQMRTGVMPETSNVIPCHRDDECKWDKEAWHRAVLLDASHADKENGTDAQWIIKRDRLPPGFSAITNKQYLLRPEAIESVFILYRITGDPKLQEIAWTMFRSVYVHTVTKLANAAILDVTNGTALRADSMESFWTAETLKYYYLIFADPDTISLDDYVFNTEAHPFARPGTTTKPDKMRWQWKWR